MKTAAFFDVDNTLIDGYSQILFAKYLMNRNLLPMKYYFRIIVWYFAYKLKLTNDSSSIRDYSIKVIKGWTPAKLEYLAKECFEHYIRPRIYQGSMALIHEHQNNGVNIVLVSSSLDVLVDPLKNYIKANSVICAKLEIRDGVYTGRVTASGVRGENKAKEINKLARNVGINLKTSYAYSDHFSDLPMLECVGNPMGINPDSKLADVCLQRSWKTYNFKDRIQMK